MMNLLARFVHQPRLFLVIAFQIAVRIPPALDRYSANGVKRQEITANQHSSGNLLPPR